ncbi:DUF3226 domain-containing protein [Myxococcus sp. Y35]|uniref:DUF3226 domain-containing protein n=1 Tax=Pseudomyxococcus flavus TaxID=3115648 RepID=UPI003CED40DA
MRDSAHRLFVEGTDDQWTIINLTKRHGIDWDDKKGPKELPLVQNTGGIDQLLETAPVAIKSYARVGVVLDADSSLQGRWSEMSKKISSIGISLPKEPEPNGTIMPGILPDSLFGIWVMPDNRGAGILEDFLSRLVPTGDQCWNFSIGATDQARLHGASFKDTALVKARIHAWLAWQEAPGRPLGAAIDAAYFNHNGPEAQAFVGWFRRLFLKAGN